MAETTKALKLTFTNSEGKKSSLTLSKVAKDLTPEIIGQAMERISQANVFNKEGKDLYISPQGAVYIERTVTDAYTNPEAKDDKQD